MSQPSFKSKWHLLAIFTLAYAVFFVGLDRAEVPTVDGAVRATEARTIVETGHWFPITYQEKAVNDHPPLFVWATAVSFKVFGVNDFAANFPSRLCAALTFIFTALIALEVGLSPGLALFAVLILATTRDFVLSSVRGYIEPMLEFFIYGGLWLAFRQRKRRSYWAALGAGICAFGAFFSKGPPALWPALAYAILLIWLGGLPGARLRVFSIYVATLALCFGALAFWTNKHGYWNDWQMYLQKQVLSSALDGRGGAQSGDHLYFIKILLKFYWPWLPFLLIGIRRSFRWGISFELTDEAIYSWIFGVFALGFLAGFSLVKWQFWYYIAPAYPAMALFIASTSYSFTKKWFAAPAFAYSIFTIALTWILIGSAMPIPLGRERVPEVIAFKNTILNSKIEEPVLFFNAPNDHNMVGTSGEWYFHKPVLKVTSLPEIKHPTWVITASETPIPNGKTIQILGGTKLVLVGTHSI